MVIITDDETKEYDKSVSKLYKNAGINIDNLTKYAIKPRALALGI